MLLFALLFLFASAVDYDDCYNPQIINGETVNIYIDNLSERTVVNGRKGVYIQMQTDEAVRAAYHFYAYESTTEVMMYQIESCSDVSESTLLPQDYVSDSAANVTYFFSVDESIEEDVIVVAEKMLASGDQENPVIIREEYLPLTFPMHTFFDDSTSYYQLIGRFNWEVIVELSNGDSQVIDLKEGGEELVTVTATSDIYNITFRLSDTAAHQSQEMVVDTIAPSVFRAVFRPAAALETTTCSTVENHVVGYSGTFKGEISIGFRADGITNTKYVNNADECVLVVDGESTSVNGNFEIMLMTTSEIDTESAVIFTVTEVSSTPESSSSEETSSSSVETSSSSVETSSSSVETSSSSVETSSSSVETSSSSVETSSSSVETSSSSVETSSSSVETSSSSVETSSSSVETSSSSVETHSSSAETSSSEPDSGMDTKTLVAIICVCVIIVLLFIIAVGLLAFILYKKFTNKAEYATIE
ncbi:Uncharacterized protein QTN25_000208 [Entamoeba marina]